MANVSAGLLLYRRTDQGVEVLIAHPGGPFWARRQQGAWSIPKGEFDPESENPAIAAAREFAEEIGTPAPADGWIAIGETKLKSGKRIVAWAVEGELDVASLVSNTFAMEWPRGSGRQIDVPEIDEVRWVRPEAAAELLNPAQAVFVERLLAALAR